MSLIINGTEVQEVIYNGDSLNKVICDGVTVFEKGIAPPQEYLTFSEENSSSFTLKVYDSTKHWNGKLYYSTDTENWTEWNGEEISSTANGKLYVCGAGNTKITGNNQNYRWVLTTGKRIQCTGNIETLLDYKTVEQGSHPQMATYCYYYLFRSCKSLTSAPELPATSLTDQCYRSMFSGCTSLTAAPELPAKRLSYQCYDSMFSGCKSLTSAPELPATSLDYQCYGGMFYGCTSLTAAPELPVIFLQTNCYRQMFYGCTSLTSSPELPATSLATGCYYQMFQNCTALTGQIHLPASVSGNSYRLKDTDITGSSATIVFDL